MQSSGMPTGLCVLVQAGLVFLVESCPDGPCLRRISEAAAFRVAGVDESIGDDASSKAMPGEGVELETAVLPTQAISPQSRALKGVSGVMRLAESTPANRT
jgi:hypothetical protein